MSALYTSATVQNAEIVHSTLRKPLRTLSNWHYRYINGRIHSSIHSFMFSTMNGWFHCNCTVKNSALL